MSPTEVTGRQVKDGSIQRKDLDITTTGEAVVRKLIAGSGISLSETGADSGTGDVTITATSVQDQANDTWLRWRDAADLNWINTFKVDANDDLLLNVKTGKVYKFLQNGDLQWSIDADGKLIQDATNGGNLVLNLLTADRALITDSSKNVVHSAVTSTELGYLSGVTSAIQTQINAKMTNPMTTLGDVIYGGASGTPTRLAVGTEGHVLKVVSGSPAWAAESGGGITTLNTLTAATQTFATGTSGTDFGISSATSTHTFNLPDASASARGVLTTAAQIIAGLKTFNAGIKLPNTIWLVARNAGDSADVNLLRLSSNDDTVIDSASAKAIILNQNGTLKYSFNSGSITYNQDSQIISNTTDGSDNRRFLICGGGSASQTQGAYIGVYGNEHAQIGRLILLSGDAGGGISFRPAGTERWKMDDSSPYAFYPLANNTTDIGKDTLRPKVVYAVTSDSNNTTLKTHANYAGSGRFASTVAVNTTNATPTNLLSMALADNTSYKFTAEIIGRYNSTTAKGCGGKLSFIVYRNNGGSAVLAADFGGALKELETYGSSNYDFDVSVSSNSVLITVTGAASETVSWVAEIKYVAVSTAS